jgi:pimeloyl-ACP methyl ester carboxylesterase
MDGFWRISACREAADECCECVSPKARLVACRQKRAELHRGQAFAECVERPDGFRDGIGAEQPGSLEALDSRLEPGQRLLCTLSEAGGERRLGQRPLHADFEQRGVLDGETAEDRDAGFDEICGRIGRHGLLFELDTEQVEGATPERNEERVLRAIGGVDGPGGGSYSLGDPSHRERLDPVAVDDPLCRGEQRIRGRLLVLSRPAHFSIITKQRHVICYNETPLRNRRGGEMHTAPTTIEDRWAGLTGRERGHRQGDGSDRPFVFLHGLTFDHRMWDPVLDLLPEGRRAIAFDLPGHGGSPLLGEAGLAPVVEAVHEAVLAAGLDEPIVVGHSIGGPLAAMYAATYPAAAVVSVDAPIRIEPFAGLLASIRPELTGDRFDEVWTIFQRDMKMEAVPAPHRELLRVGDHASQEVVLRYQADLLDGSLDDVIRQQESGMAELRQRGVPYISLHAKPVDQNERHWLLERIPQAEIVVWPVEHHFPHLAAPDRLVALVTGLAAGPTAPLQEHDEMRPA